MKMDMTETSSNDDFFVEQSYDMGFSTGSENLLMSFFDNLYTNPAYAVAREVICNSIDSMAKIGSKNPVHVTLPTYNSPTFISKDTGEGLDGQGIKQMFQYGGSTKRKNNKEMGGFGLGAKSPLSITDSFVVIGIKNGVKYHAVIKKSTSFSTPNKIEIISTTKTVEPNGVEVRVPIKNIENFREAAQSFLFGVSDKKVLVDGQPIENNINSSKDWVKISNKVGYVNLSNALKRSNMHDNKVLRIILGEVIYKITIDSEGADDLVNNYGSRHVYRQSVLRVPIASIDVTPSRDEIRFTEKTLKTLTKTFENFESDFLPFMEKRFDKVATPSEAVVFQHALLEPFGSTKVKWGQYDFPENFTISEMYDVFSTLEITKNSDKKNTKMVSRSTLKLVEPIRRSGEHVYLFEYSTPNELEQFYKDVADFTASLPDDPTTSWFIHNKNSGYGKMDLIDKIWVNKISKTISGKEIHKAALATRREIRNDKAKRKNLSPASDGVRYPALIATINKEGNFNGYHKSHLPSKVLPEDVIFVLDGEMTGMDYAFMNKKFMSTRGENFVNLLKAANVKEHVVYVPKRLSAERFLRSFPNARNLSSIFPELIQDLISNVNEDDLALYAARKISAASDLSGVSSRKDLMSEHLHKIVNPNTRAILKVMEEPETEGEKIIKVLVNNGYLKKEMKNYEGNEVKTSYPLVRYNYYNSPVDHIIVYINAVDNMV